MRLHGFDTQIEPVCNLLCRAAFGDQLENFPLASREFPQWPGSGSTLTTLDIQREFRHG